MGLSTFTLIMHFGWVFDWEKAAPVHSRTRNSVEEQILNGFML